MQGQYTERIVWQEMPEDDSNMEFRLVYEGPMKSARTGGQHGKQLSGKHAIRKALHKQLIHLWQIIPDLKMRSERHSILSAPPEGQNPRTITSAAAIARESLWETLGNRFDRCGHKFVPLVSKHLNLCCSLEVLFLQRDKRGQPLIDPQSGDIDNRMKILFDALQIPQACEGMGTKDADEEPYFFVLLEDDALITELKVTTDNLLTRFVPTPATPGCTHPENFVHLVITVKVRPRIFSFENAAFVT